MGILKEVVVPLEIVITINDSDINAGILARTNRQLTPDAIGEALACYCPVWQGMRRAVPEAIKLSAGHWNCIVWYPLREIEPDTWWCKVAYYLTPEDLRKQMQRWDVNCTPFRPGTFTLALDHTAKEHYYDTYHD